MYYDQNDRAQLPELLKKEVGFDEIISALRLTLEQEKAASLGQEANEYRAKWEASERRLRDQEAELQELRTKLAAYADIPTRDRPSTMLGDTPRMGQINADTKRVAKDQLEKAGYNCDQWADHFTEISGVKNPQGEEVLLIIKSALTGVVYLNPSEWIRLAEHPRAQLLIEAIHGQVQAVSLADIEREVQAQSGGLFFLQFALPNNILHGLTPFAKLFARSKFQTHFILDVPDFSHTARFVREFGLHGRPEATLEEVEAVGPDDI